MVTDLHFGLGSSLIDRSKSRPSFLKTWSCACANRLSSTNQRGVFNRLTFQIIIILLNLCNYVTKSSVRDAGMAAMDLIKLSARDASSQYGKKKRSFVCFSNLRRDQPERTRYANNLMANVNILERQLCSCAHFSNRHRTPERSYHLLF